MKGEIKAIDGVYPITVMNAVKVGDGTSKNLTEYLQQLNLNGGMQADYSKYISKTQDATINLFNKDTVEKWGYYDVNNNGAWREDTGIWSSDFIEIEPSTTYIRSSSSGILETFYDENKTFLGGARTQQFITPSNAKYVRLAVLVSTLDTEMLVKGSTLPSTYIPCRPTDVYKIPSISFDVEVRNNSISETKLSSELQNKINKTDLERFERALPKVPLKIETYDAGANEPYHPSVVKFDTAWNGYKYWMAYTPFPNEANENPCICASNDLIKWETPNGLTNPLDKPHDYDTGATGYWSDTHLVYNSNTDTLECWYRGIGASATGENNICRKKSTDGVTWEEREVLFTFTGGSYVSPSIIYDENKYKIWFCRPNERYESTDGTNWTKLDNYSFFPTNYKFWHQDIIKTDVGYELVGMEEVGKNTRIIHFTSEDGNKFKFGKEIVKVLSNNKYGIKGFYKPALVKDNDVYYLFLSINWTNGTNGMSLSISDKLNDITSLVGINQDYIPYMSKYTKKPLSAFEGDVIFDKTRNKMIYCTKGGRNSTWVDFNGNIV